MSKHFLVGTELSPANAKKLQEGIELLKSGISSEISDINGEAGINYLIQSMQYLRAAGGIVQSKNSRFLLIERLNHWDLPKGKIENNETPEFAAKREISEETGVNQISNAQFISFSWHIYQMRNKYILKETSWFHFLAEEEVNPIIQVEEQITDAGWFSSDEMEGLKPKMFASVRDLINDFFSRD